MSNLEVYIRFYYDEYSDKTNSYLHVEFHAERKIPYENYRLRKRIFDVFLNNRNTDDIVKIISKLREIFAGLVEDEFIIELKNEDSQIYVKYLNGKFSSYDYKLHSWDDIISITDNYRGIDVQIKKSQAGFYNKECTEDIFKQVMPYFENIYALRELTAEKTATKVKTKR